MIDWRLLNFHSLLWHLGFYSEYMGGWPLAKVFFRILAVLPSKSHKSLIYRSMAAAKLAPFGIVSKPLLRKLPHFDFVREIQETQAAGKSLSSLFERLGDSDKTLRGVWSIADLAELNNERTLATDIYSFIAQIPCITNEEYVYSSISLFRLGRASRSLEVLDRGLKLFPESSELRKTKRTVGLSSGNLKAFLNLPETPTLYSKKAPKLLDEAAKFVVSQSLGEFAIRLSGFLGQDALATDELISLILKKLEKRVFVFPYIEYVLVTMFRGGVPVSTILKFREVMKFRAFSKKQRAKKNRVLDISLLANFSYSFDLQSDLSPIWNNVAELNNKKVLLDNPLKELPIWTPWVGAFVQAPRTPLWKTVESLLPLVRSTWPLVDFVAPHTMELPKSKVSKIKLGFLYHSSMPMISGLLRFFPKNEFDTFFIYPKDEALSKEALKWKAATEFTFEINPWDLESSISAISKLELDILIAGPFNAPMWFTTLARLARLQAILIEPAWIDGSANLDYYISWEPAEPIDFQNQYQSSVALLKSPPYWIEALDAIGGPTKQMKEALLKRLIDWREGERVYLCANTILKLHPDMDDAIEGILTSDPSGVVVLLRTEGLGGDSLKVRLRSRLGKDFTRLRFLNSLVQSDAHDLLRSVDCVFDSFPITGMSSSFDGLKLGVPIVTIESEISFGKWTSAIYRYIGISGLTARSKSEFVSICTSLASNENLREQYSLEISTNYRKLIESDIAAKELVQFLRSAWSRYCAGYEPADWVNSQWVTRKS